MSGALAAPASGTSSQAAQVPLGSFTNHFASKEAFGLEILDLYYDNSRAHIAETLSNEALRPLERIAAYIDHNIAVQNGADMRRGCLFGNFGAEVVDQSEAMRLRLVEMFENIRQSFASCLNAAAAAHGEGGPRPALPAAYGSAGCAGPGGRDEVACMVELGGVERGTQPHEVSASGPTTSANRSR